MKLSVLFFTEFVKQEEQAANLTRQNADFGKIIYVSNTKTEIIL